jgi:hypothetical protein
VFLSILALAFSLGVDAGDASAPSAAASPAVVTLTGQQILDKVTAVWESRQEPPYEAFTMPCHEILRTGAEGSCGSSTSMRVYLRTSDGIAHVVTIPKGDEKPVVLLPAGHIYGPAYAPLGFTRKLGATQRVGSLAADPFAPMPTIAAVMAVNYAYDVSVAPDVCQGAPAYRLTLKPHGTNASRPLRELLVDQQSYHIHITSARSRMLCNLAAVKRPFATTSPMRTIPRSRSS